MGPSFRYHVATVVAIFLALGLGMVIGSSHLQEALVDRLRVQLSELSNRFANEIIPLRKVNEQQARAIELLTARTTRGALPHTRVAIAVTGDYGDAAQQAAHALRQAGATVESTTTFPASFTTRLDIGLPSLMQDLGEQRPAGQDRRTTVFQLIARLMAQGGSSRDLQRLTEARLIEADGEYRRRVNLVVLIGGARDEGARRWESIDFPLIEQFEEIGTTVVGAEPEAAAQTYIPAYQSKSVSTVDNIDTGIGLTCLVLLAGGERGSYGVKSTARDGLLPLGAQRP